MLLNGNPVSSGVAVGRLLRYERQVYTVQEAHFEGPPDAHLAAFFAAQSMAAAELDEVIASFPPENAEYAKIFSAHKDILEDEELVECVTLAITEEHAMPEFAVDNTIADFIQLLSGADDPLIAARVADMQDVRGRLLRNLRGEKEQMLSRLPEDVILLAHDLLPSDTASMDIDHVLGIITEIGSDTSHSAILARSFGIPTLVGTAGAMAYLRDGEEVILDALKGCIITEPTSEQLAQAERERRSFLLRRAEQDKFWAAEGLTEDGIKLEIGINVGSEAADRGFEVCDYVGLFRTEFLYMNQTHMPTEEEQLAAYIEVLRQAKGRPVTLRTLDIGGDKTLPYLELPKEENPFLGKRALRLCLDRRDIFKTQLRAALRASAHGELWIMFPMVGSLDDLRKAKAEVEAAKEELRTEGLPFDEKIRLGIMIEIPSIALIADIAAKEADFASIGTNDLCQYTMAVDRMNSGLFDYYQSLSPAMLRILNTAISAFRAAGKPISVCGEMSGDPLSAAALVGMGLRKLSMSSASISRVKAALSKITVEQAAAAVKEAMDAATEAEVRARLSRLLGN